jgi:catechol 2,3-dioxygenase-like lactoylglutathione lyase family enzyme
MKVRKIDHVGINVIDLAAAKAFFLELGFEVMGEAELGGEFVERVIGLQNVKDKVVMLRTPDGEASIELIQFLTPLDEKGIQPSFANTLGIRHIALVVDDVEAIVAKLKKNGTELFGEVLNYENTYKDCFVRGPEGIIVELAEELQKDSGGNNGKPN